MGKMDNGLTGGFRGKLGTVVGAKMNGQYIVRNAPKKGGRKPTSAQLNHRNKFRLVSKFLRPINKVIKRFFDPDTEAKSKINIALAYHLKEAVKEMDGEYVIDFEKVVISKGILITIFVDQVILENKEFTITWSSNSVFNTIGATDTLTLVLYQKSTKSTFVFENVVQRSAMEFKFQLPGSFEETGYALWGFMSDEAGVECSTSLFLGEY
ncbi:hypothetical protein HX004_13850 [Myroides sp. 1354]|uniref:DUF6266 family protein n=1 Tax=unclassified Myroides TaxID=2642485 RepID=UPI0025750E56|nr:MULTISPECIES: DUF6266 family protein [unclassified Myroides]MDM1044451.1 hypothetical protein [Myroides sp. R163-1]MDM1056847.1 hypothetical protein [Myroides sp. 1354]MDM1069882.1 hypothetical protein [Myroides sp. 1372]